MGHMATTEVVAQAAGASVKCRECSGDAVVRVTVNEEMSVVCEMHRVAIVKRIEQSVRKLGLGNQNVQSILVMALSEIQFEDLPSVVG